MEKIDFRLRLCLLSLILSINIFYSNATSAQINKFNVKVLEIRNNEFDHGTVKGDTTLQTAFTLVNKGSNKIN